MGLVISDFHEHVTHLKEPFLLVGLQSDLLEKQEAHVVGRGS